MAERRLLAAMQDEVAAKIAAVEREAEEAIRGIDTAVDQALTAERAEAESRLRDLADEYERRARRQREQEWRSRIREMQFELVEQAFHALALGAAEIRRRDDYPKVWTHWFAEALTVYGREQTDAPILRTAPADRHLADRHAAAVAGVELSDSLADGLELLSPDGRVRVVNTSASRVDRGRDEFLKLIADTFRERVSP